MLDTNAQKTRRAIFNWINESKKVGNPSVENVRLIISITHSVEGVGYASTRTTYMYVGKTEPAPESTSIFWVDINTEKLYRIPPTGNKVEINDIAQMYSFNAE